MKVTIKRKNGAVTTVSHVSGLAAERIAESLATQEGVIEIDIVPDTGPQGPSPRAAA